MKKLLILVVVMALLTPVFAAESIQWGGSIEARGYWYSPDNGLDSKYMESEIYLWAVADLADNVMAKISLKFENDFGTAPSSDGVTSGNVDLWEGYVRLAQINECPVSLVVGRWVNEWKPEGSLIAVPRCGEGFYIPNNRPVDGFKTIWDTDNFTLIFMGVKMVENIRTQNDDGTMYAAYFTTKAIENQVIDAYAGYGDIQGTTPDESYTHAWIIGARAAGKITPVEGLSYKAEIAYIDYSFENPFIKDDGGFGGYIGAAYTFANDYKPSVRANFYYLDDNFKQPHRHVDAQDLGEHSYGYGAIADSNANLVQNVWFVNLGGSMQPTEKIKADIDVYYYEQPQATIIGPFEYDKIGTELDLCLSYQYSENVAAELIGAYFTPADEQLSATINTPGGDTWLLKGSLKVSF